MIVNKQELEALGINPDSPMSSPRTRTDPIDVQYGEDHIQRTSSGGITRSFGYYTEYQQNARKRWAREVFKNLPRSTFAKVFNENI